MLHATPGLARLFPLDPGPTRYRVVTDGGRSIVGTGHLAGAVIAAAAVARTAGGAWLARTDAWELHLDQHGHIAHASGPAPLDAIQRVLHSLPVEEGPPR